MGEASAERFRLNVLWTDGSVTIHEDVASWGWIAEPTPIGVAPMLLLNPNHVRSVRIARGASGEAK